MALPDDFLPLDDIPEPLRAPLAHARDRVASSLEQADNLADMTGSDSPLEDWLSLSEVRRRQLARVLAISSFAAETLVRYPDWLLYLDASGELDETPAAESLRSWLDERLEAAEDEADLHAAIRRFRRARMLGIVWRDLTRPPGIDMWVTAAAVSRLAETCLEAALAWLEAHFAPRWGRPTPRRDGSEQRLVVLGMGKLGAGELNLSSDIDLIFAFPEKGETEGGRKPLEHQEYFTKIGQRLITALDAVTADGFAFRVDMRLRPLGDGGPLVGAFSSLSGYYQDQGREWERYAMIKARVVGGDYRRGRQLLETLRPFVYRRYLDFGAIESLRELKAMINREVRRKGMQGNIKLGPGGIREVEFVVQAFQLIRGGRDTELQVTSLRTALQRLPELGLLPREVVDELTPDYVFLRDLEHVLQALEDRQTQTLPADDTDRERVALALDMEDWPAVMARLDEVRERVRRHFDAVIAEPEEEVEGADKVEASGPLAGDSTVVVSIVGIDGCGKSSAFRGTVEALARSVDVIGVGEEVVGGRPGETMRQRTDLPLSRSARIVGRLAKGLRRPGLYKQVKFLEFVERARIRADAVADQHRGLQPHRAPELVEPPLQGEQRRLGGSPLLSGTPGG